MARQDVRVSGTEILHRACAAAGGETVGLRQQREIADLRSQLVHAQESVQRAIASQQQQANRLRTQLSQAKHETSLARLAQGEAAAALAAVARERDALRLELAQRPVQPIAPAPPPEEPDDAAVTRFSLIELDR